MEVPASPNIENPYNQGNGYVPRIQNLDNGNTIIIFEGSFTGSIEDTLISARQQWEVSYIREKEIKGCEHLTLLFRVDGDVSHSI